MTETGIEVKQSEIPVINYAHCIQCKTCIEVCPKDVISDPVSFTCSKCVKYCITMEVPCSPDNYVFNYGDCNSCGTCIEQCPSNALVWYKVMMK